MFVSEYPKEIIKPKPTVITGVHPKIDASEITMRVKFECRANINVQKYTVDVRWYINKNEIKKAYYHDISPEKLHDALLLQEHWEKTYKPDMNV